MFQFEPQVEDESTEPWPLVVQMSFTTYCTVRTVALCPFHLHSHFSHLRMENIQYLHWLHSHVTLLLSILWQPFSSISFKSNKKHLPNKEMHMQHRQLQQWHVGGFCCFQQNKTPVPSMQSATVRGWTEIRTVCSTVDFSLTWCHLYYHCYVRVLALQGWAQISLWDTHNMNPITSDKASSWQSSHPKKLIKDTSKNTNTHLWKTLCLNKLSALFKFP